MAEDRALESSFDTFDAYDFFDLKEPQPKYRAFLETGGVACPAEGMVMVGRRDAAERALQDYESFSAEGIVNLGNVRPLIPLSVDPPRHSKYRKILDLLFAPKQMEKLEDDVTARANRFIDAFADRGECHFTNEFAVPYPSSVFLGLMGLPWEELDTFLRLKDGILRPSGNTTDAEARARVQYETGQEIYAYFDAILDERMAEPRDDILDHFLRAEIDGEKLTARRDPRHLLPVPHRRARHRHRHAHVLVRVPGPAPRPSPSDRNRPVGDPRGGRGAAALGDAGPERVPHGHRRHRARQLPGEGRLVRLDQPGRGQPRHGRHDDAFDVRFDRGATATSRSAAACTGASARTSPGASCASRCASGTAASPTTSSLPGLELEYPLGLRSVENLQLRWPSAAL